MEKYLFAICFLSQLNLYGAELGRVSISGQGCDEPKKKVSILKESNEPQKVEMPLHFKLDKINASRFERKVCNISLPIKLNKNEKKTD